MFVISYVLNADGTIPSNVPDGGYFPVENELPWPQNLTLCGVASSVEQYHQFNTESDLEEYLADVGKDWTNIDGSPFDPVSNAKWLWDKSL